MDLTPQVKGIYFTLNPVNPAFPARKVNRISKQGDLPLTVLDPDDFHPINGVRSGPCVECGGKWVHYTEKFSQKQKEEGRFAHKICQKCYSKAVARKCQSFTALPGLLNTRTMIPANKDLGRCDVCDTGAAMGGP